MNNFEKEIRRLMTEAAAETKYVVPREMRGSVDAMRGLKSRRKPSKQTGLTPRSIAFYTEQVKKRYYNPQKHEALFVLGKHGLGKTENVEAVLRKCVETDLKDGYVENGVRKPRTFIEFNKIMDDDNQIMDILRNPERYYLFFEIKGSQMESYDLPGIPIIDIADKTNLPVMTKREFWMMYITGNVRTGKESPDLMTEKIKGCLFYDEVNHTDTEILKAMQTIFDPPLAKTKRVDGKVVRDIGKTKSNRTLKGSPIAEKVIIIAAGNILDENNKMDVALLKPLEHTFLQRFYKMELAFDQSLWFEWATENNIHPVILAFLSSRYNKNGGAGMFYLPPKKDANGIDIPTTESNITRSTDPGSVAALSKDFYLVESQFFQMNQNTLKRSYAGTGADLNFGTLLMKYKLAAHAILGGDWADDFVKFYKEAVAQQMNNIFTNGLKVKSLRRSGQAEDFSDFGELLKSEHSTASQNWINCVIVRYFLYHLFYLKRSKASMNSGTAKAMRKFLYTWKNSNTKFKKDNADSFYDEAFELLTRSDKDYIENVEEESTDSSGRKLTTFEMMESILDEKVDPDTIDLSADEKTEFSGGVLNVASVDTTTKSKKFGEIETNLLDATPEQTLELLDNAWHTKKSFIIFGKSGIGKTTTINDFVDDKIAELGIDPKNVIRPTSSLGAATVEEYKEKWHELFDAVSADPNKYFIYVPVNVGQLSGLDFIGIPDPFKQLGDITRGDPMWISFKSVDWVRMLSIKGVKGVLYLDELTHATNNMVISALYDLLIKNNRRIKNNYLSKNVAVFCSANLKEDLPTETGAPQERMAFTDALNRRFQGGAVEWRFDYEAWRDRGLLHPDLISWMEAVRASEDTPEKGEEKLEGYIFKIDPLGYKSNSPRSMETFSEKYDTILNELDETLSGLEKQEPKSQKELNSIIKKQKEAKKKFEEELDGLMDNIPDEVADAIAYHILAKGAVSREVFRTMNLTGHYDPIRVKDTNVEGLTYTEWLKDDLADEYRKRVGHTTKKSLDDTMLMLPSYFCGQFRQMVNTSRRSLSKWTPEQIEKNKAQYIYEILENITDKEQLEFLAEVFEVAHRGVSSALNKMIQKTMKYEDPTGFLGEIYNSILDNSPPNILSTLRELQQRYRDSIQDLYKKHNAGKTGTTRRDAVRQPPEEWAASLISDMERRRMAKQNAVHVSSLTPDLSGGGAGDAQTTEVIPATGTTPKKRSYYDMG